MKYLSKTKEYLSNKHTTNLLINSLLICAIVYLCYLNIPVIQYIFNLLWLIIKPFLIGFIIAYILEPLIYYLSQKGIQRILALLIVYLCAFILIIVLVLMVIPTLYQRLSDLFISLSEGIVWIQNMISNHSTIDISQITNEFINVINSFLSSESMVDMTIGVLSEVTNTITSYIIYFIVAIYISADYPQIHHKIKMLAYKIDETLPSYMRAIDITMLLYIRSYSLVIIVQILMCSVMYFIAGHPNWLLLALLSGMSSLIPYIGPLVVNVIAIVTALNLGTYKIILLLIFIFIQSNVMGYAVMPKIFSKGLDLSPISVIFGLLTGLTLFGPIGMLIAMPLLIVLKVIFSINKSM